MTKAYRAYSFQQLFLYSIRYPGGRWNMKLDFHTGVNYKKNSELRYYAISVLY